MMVVIGIIIAFTLPAIMIDINGIRKALEKIAKRGDE